MEAIVTLLEPTAYSRIEALWRILELKCGLQGIKTTPFPHFSWQVADSYQIKPLDEVLKAFSEKAVPFSVNTAGVGLFTGNEPVLYMLIVKDNLLFKFHQEVWEKCHPFAVRPADYYAPDTWVPHVTLAHTDVNKSTLPCALQELAFLPFNWELRIDNLSLVSREDDEVGRLVTRYDFKQK